MISIIIPTYNEKGNILTLIRSILAVIDKNKLNAEILVIDDNSPDKTGVVTAQTYKDNKDVRIFIRKHERGLATAIYYGIKKAKGDIIIGIDADFNHPPELIPALVQKLSSSKLVVASRFIKGGGMDEWGRYIGTYIFNYFLNHVLGFPIMDNMSGYYAIKMKTLVKLNPRKIYYGYGDYHLRLVWFAMKKKMKIVELPVHYKKRSYGKSKSHLVKMLLTYLLHAIKLRLKIITPHIV